MKENTDWFNDNKTVDLKGSGKDCGKDLEQNL